MDHHCKQTLIIDITRKQGAIHLHFVDNSKCRFPLLLVEKQWQRMPTVFIIIIFFFPFSHKIAYGNKLWLTELYIFFSLNKIDFLFIKIYIRCICFNIDGYYMYRDLTLDTMETGLISWHKIKLRTHHVVLNYIHFANLLRSFFFHVIISALCTNSWNPPKKAFKNS